MKSKQSVSDLWNAIKRNNLQITGVTEGKKRGRKKWLNGIMADNFPNVKTDLTIQAHKVHISLNNHNLNRFFPRHIVKNQRQRMF